MSRREDAMWSLRRGAEEAGTSIVSVKEWEEPCLDREPPATLIKFVGVAADGRKFGIHYEKSMRPINGL